MFPLIFEYIDLVSVLKHLLLGNVLGMLYLLKYMLHILHDKLHQGRLWYIQMHQKPLLRTLLMKVLN